MKPHRLHSFVFLFLATALPLCTRAQLISNASTVQIVLSDHEQTTTTTRDTFGGSGVLSFGSNAGGSVSANASGGTSPGVVKARASGSATSNVVGPTNAAYAIVDVSYQDTLTITGQAEGTAGLLSTSFYVPHTVTTSASGDFWGGAAITIIPFTASVGLGVTRQDYVLAFSDLSNQSLEFESTFPEDFMVTLNTPFVYGTPFDLRMAIGGGAAAFGLSIIGGPGSGAFDVNFSNSIYWAGGARVTDLDGDALSFILTAESGIDYNRSWVPGSIHPVPEPATYAFGAMALLGCVVAARGRLRRKAGIA